MIVNLLFLSINSKTFLGDSQTLLGVIVTLLVLCLFYEGTNKSSKYYSPPVLRDDHSLPNKSSHITLGEAHVSGSNFLFRILHTEKKRIQNQINAIADSLLNSRKDVSNLTERIRSVLASNHNNRDIVNLCGNFISKYQQLASSLEIKTVAEQFKAMNNIETDNEQFRAPLYCFALGTLLFILDELWIIFPSHRNILCLFAAFITIISIIYWILVWFASCFSDLKYKNWPIRKAFDFLPVNLGAELSSMIIISILASLSYWILNAIISNFNPPIWIILFVILTPVVIFGILKLITCRIRGNYSFSHILRHFLILSSYSFLLSLLLLYGNISQEMKPIIESSFLVKQQLISVISVIFILINGLLFPFLLPLIRYRILLFNNTLYALWVKFILKGHKIFMRREYKRIMIALGEANVPKK